MKTILCLSAMAIGVLSFATQNAFSQCHGGGTSHTDHNSSTGSTKSQTDDVYAITELTGYVCPMHPEVISDKPSKCSKCGMDLVKKVSDVTEGKQEKDSVYYGCCPGCPEIRMDKPGKCPKCGMTLEKRTMKSSTAPEKKSETGSYSCPMHPDVNSDKPGSCPKCGMNLEKTK